MNNTASIVSRVWSFCHTLRDDGVSYGDYLEQLKSRTRQGVKDHHPDRQGSQPGGPGQPA
jgi:hypothetical protein